MSIIPTSGFGRACLLPHGQVLAAAGFVLTLSLSASAQEAGEAEEPAPPEVLPAGAEETTDEAAAETAEPVGAKLVEEKLPAGEIEPAEEVLEPPPPPGGRIPEDMLRRQREEELLEAATAGLVRERARAVRRLYREALRAYRARRFRIAVTCCEAALRNDPENLAVQRMLYTAKIAKQKHELRLEAEHAYFLDEDALADVDRAATFPEKELPLPRPELPLRENAPKSPRLRRMQELLNQRVSMNFIEADLDYVLQTLFKISGVDIIAEQSVIADKTLTLHVENVPLREILDFIKRNYEGVEYTVTENAVWFVTPEKPRLVPRTYHLSRGIVSSAGFTTGVRTGARTGTAGPTAVSGTGAQGQARAAASAGGQPSQSHLESALDWIETWEDEWPANSQWYLDRQTNTLMVLTTPEMHERIEEMLDVMDTVPIQVLVRTKFIEVRAEDMKELGLGFAFLEAEQVTLYKDNLGVADIPTIQGGNLSFRRLYEVGTGGIVLDLKALMEDKRAKVLSAPHVIAMNNTPAQIDVSKTFSYSTGFQAASAVISGDTSSSAIPTAFIPSDFQDVNVGFFLEFVPSVGRDMKNIVLDLHARIDEVFNLEDFLEAPIITGAEDIQQSFPRPIIDSREFTTRLVVEDGGTVTIGGLLKNNKEVINRRVPILGDIPLIGLLFRARKEVTVQSNLIIVVQADIVTPSGRTYAKPGAERDGNPRGAGAGPEWFTEFEPRLEGEARGYGAR